MKNVIGSIPRELQHEIFVQLDEYDLQKFSLTNFENFRLISDEMPHYKRRVYPKLINKDFKLYCLKDYFTNNIIRQLDIADYISFTEYYHTPVIMVINGTGFKRRGKYYFNGQLSACIMYTERSRIHHDQYTTYTINVEAYFKKYKKIGFTTAVVTGGDNITDIYKPSQFISLQIHHYGVSGDKIGYQIKIINQNVTIYHFGEEYKNNWDYMTKFTCSGIYKMDIHDFFNINMQLNPRTLTLDNIREFSIKSRFYGEQKFRVREHILHFTNYRNIPMLSSISFPKYTYHKSNYELATIDLVEVDPVDNHSYMVEEIFNYRFFFEILYSLNYLCRFEVKLNDKYYIDKNFIHQDISTIS